MFNVKEYQLSIDILLLFMKRLNIQFLKTYVTRSLQITCKHFYCVTYLRHMVFFHLWQISLHLVVDQRLIIVLGLFVINIDDLSYLNAWVESNFLMIPHLTTLCIQSIYCYFKLMCFLLIGHQNYVLLPMISFLWKNTLLFTNTCSKFIPILDIKELHVYSSKQKIHMT